MSEQVKKIYYYYAIVDDKPGEGRKLLEFCSAHGVNLLNITAFPLGDGKAQIDFFPEYGEKLKHAAEEANVPLVGPKKAFIIQGSERVGALIEYHLKLANEGINITAANGTSDGQGGFGYIIWVHPEDYEKAAKVLGV